MPRKWITHAFYPPFIFPMPKRIIIERTLWASPPLPHRIIAKLPPFRPYKTTMLFPGLYRVPVSVVGARGEKRWDDIDWYEQDIIVRAKNPEEAEREARKAYEEVGLQVMVG
jgi:hypothetical protein